MVEAVRESSRGIVRDFGEISNLQGSSGGPVGFVSAANKRVERILTGALLKIRPGYGLFSPGQEAIQGSDGSHRWIISPIDGLENMLHGMPFFCTSAALERQETIVAGVVYNPVSGELFAAERGKGAYLNDRRLRVAARFKLAGSLISTVDSAGSANARTQLQKLGFLIQAGASVRSLGCCALSLAYVASSGFDGCVGHGDSVNFWNYAAGSIIVREAGGFVSDNSGKTCSYENGSIVAGNEKIHQQLLSVISRI